MMTDLVPIQIAILVPCNPTLETMQFSTEISDELLAEYTSARTEFMRVQGLFADALKKSQDAKRPPILTL